MIRRPTLRSLSLNQLKSFFPVLRILVSWIELLGVIYIPQQPDLNTEARESSKQRMRIGKGVLEESRAAALGTGEKGDNLGGRDLLSLLIKANLSDNENQRMTDQDVVARKYLMLTLPFNCSLKAKKLLPSFSLVTKRPRK